MEIKVKVINLFLALLVVCVAVCGTLTGVATASAASVESDPIVCENIGDNAAEPYALFVDVALGLNGGGGEVWAIAKTKSAIFATSIQVIVELYCSDTYQESYTDMTLVAKVSTSNLKQGQSIQATMPTNGEQKYWKGRMYYKADSASWKYGVTKTLLLDANGVLVG